MSELDASVLGRMGDYKPTDVVGAIAGGFQLKDMKANTEMNQLKLADMKKTQQNEQTINNLLKSSDLSSSKGVAEAAEKLTKAGFAHQGMNLMKEANQFRTGEYDTQLKKMEYDDKLQDTLVTTLEGVVGPLSQLEGKLTPAEMDAKVKAVMPNVLLKFKQDHADNPALTKIADQFMQNPNSMTWAGLKAAEASTKSGQAAHKQRIEEMRARTQERNIDSEIEARSRTQDRSDKRANKGTLSDKAQEIRDEMLLQGVTVGQGLRSKDVFYDSLNGLAKKYPDMAASDIVKQVKSGQLKMSGEKTEAGVLARREAGIIPVEKSIVKPGGFLDQAESAVNKVNFDKLKLAGKFENWSKEQNSDPDLASYKARVAELRAEYALVLSKGGQVTDAARHESEKVIPDIITPAQFKEIRNVITQGIEAAKGGVRESIEENQGTSKPPADGDYSHLWK